MNEINKKTGFDMSSMTSLRAVGFVLLTLASLFVLVKTLGEIKGYKYIGGGVMATNIISVSGQGEIIAVPDIATFSFTVSEENKVVTQAQEKATSKMNAVIDFLKKNGVADKDVKTTSYTIYPRYEYADIAPGYGNQVLAAYVVSQTIEVKVRKIDNAGTLLSGIGSLGGTNVSGLTLSVDNYDDLVKEARSKAIADARANAQKLAKDLGVELGRITSYYDQSPMPYYSARAEAMGGVYADKVSAPQLPAGENKIVSTINVNYEIK